MRRGRGAGRHCSNRRLRPGSKGRVCGYRGRGPFRRRLMDMGFTPGTEFTVKKEAPFGDPLIVNVRGYDVSVRRKDIERIMHK